jgi:methionyl-tRNA formyltransferase
MLQKDSKNKMKNPRILFCGSTIESLHCLEKLNQKFDVQGVLTKPASRKTRRGEKTKNEIHQFADANNIPVFTAKNKSDVDINLPEIKSLDFDLCIVVSFGVIMSMDFINLFKNGCWNIHFSRLPANKGPAPVERSLLNNENHFGYSIFQLDKGCDTGATLYVSEPMEFNWKVSVSQIRMQIIEAATEKLIEIIESGKNIELTPQVGVSSHAGFLSKEDFQILASDDFNGMLSKIRLEKAWFLIDGVMVKIISIKDIIMNEVAVDSPYVNNRGEIFVENQTIVLDEIVPQSKSLVKAKTWFGNKKDKSLI